MIGMRAFLFREWKLFSHSELEIGMSLILPIITLLVFATNMGGVVGEVGGVPYVQFVVPGIAIMASMNNASQASSRTFNERYNNILPELFSMPATKPAYIFSKILATTLIASVQGMVFYFGGILLFHLPINVQGVFLSLAGIFLSAWGLSNLFLCLALLIKDMQAFLVTSNLLGQILMWTSTVFYPSETMPSILKWISAINPMSHGTNTLRAALYNAPGQASWLFMLVFSLILGALTIWLLSKRQDSLI